MNHIDIIVSIHSGQMINIRNFSRHYTLYILTKLVVLSFYHRNPEMVKDSLSETGEISSFSCLDTT